MKKSVLIALLWISCVACDQNKDEIPQAQNQITNVAYRQLTQVTISGQALNVNVLEVNESRCPKDVVCIQEGSVNIVLNISDGTNEIKIPVAFKDSVKESGKQTFVLGKQNYSLTIREVLPYPVSTEQTDVEDYKVSLSIEKI
jgi:hypothetical protein